MKGLFVRLLRAARGRSIYFLCACFITLFAISCLLLFLARSPRSIEAYAQKVVAICAPTLDHAKCYEQEVPSLMDHGVSFEDAFEVAYAIQQLDTSGEYCHQIGHELGSREVAKDPTKWKEVARRTPLGKCLAGGLHGAFQEHFKRESLSKEQLPQFVEEIQGFCDVRSDIPSSPIDLSMCAHGLGHLFLFATNGDINDSVHLCSAVSFADGGGVTAEGQELSCLDGMFMQLFEPHEPEDYALIGNNGQSKDTVGAFCNTFEPLAQAACIARSAPMFYKNAGAAGPKPLDCGVLTSDRRKQSCFSTQLRLFARDTFFNLDATDDYCAAYPEDRRGLCYASAGSFAFMSGYDYDQPFRFCERAATRGVGGQCYQTLASMIPSSFREDDPSRTDLCKRLPSPYDAQCTSAPSTR